MAHSDPSAPTGTLPLIKRLLWENAKDKWLGYLVVIVLMLIGAGMTAMTAWLMEDVINGIFVEKRSEMVPLIAGGMFLIFFVRALTGYGSAVILSRIRNSIAARLQARVYDVLMSQGARYFDGQQFGDVMVRFQKGISNTRDAINLLVLSLGRDVLTFLSLVVVMVSQSWVMSVFALVITPLAVLGIMSLMQRIANASRSEIAAAGRLISLIKESYQGFRVIKSFTLEDHMRARADVAIEDARTQQNRIALFSALSVPLMDVLGGAAFAATLLYGGGLITAGTLDAGSLFSFIVALLMVYDPARRLAKFNVDFREKLVGVELVYELLDHPTDPSEKNAGPALHLTHGEIRLKDVGFAYEEDQILKDLNLTIPGSKVTALVGPSGGGKSTILSLLIRMRVPSSGQILLDGQDIVSLPAQSLRQQIAMVGQESFLFDISIRENLRMGRLNATDAEIETAAKNANAHDFIMALPRGYDSMVGESGGQVSGGQRQRLAIARAMLADAPILLLDEATSALDTVSEQKVLEALERLMQGRTTVVIAHRLSTIRHADQVCVIKDGTLLESGNHDSLIAKGGLYAELAKTQFG